MSYLQSKKVPSWQENSVANIWPLYKKYLLESGNRVANQNVPMTCSYTHGATVNSNTYLGGVLTSNGRIYMAPAGQATSGTWHYIDSKTGYVVPYTNNSGVTPSGTAYYGCVLDQKERVWFVPFAQSNVANWHYIDTDTGNVVAYAHGFGTTIQTLAYIGGVFVPGLNRIYLIPYRQSNSASWHYIDTVTKTVVAYSQNSGVTPVTEGYTGGCLAPNGRIYLSPRMQGPQSSSWHYIDTNTGNVVAYSQNSGVTASAGNSGSYAGATLSHTTNRIYFSPLGQATQANWHYVDLTTGNVVAYAHGRIDVFADGYCGCVTANDGKIFLAPFSQAQRENWHYIDAAGAVQAYDPRNDVAAVDQGYVGGVAAPDGRVYFIPYAQATGSWHYVQTNVIENWNSIVQTSPFFNKF